ncbi:MAG TPA: BON domain-containing protein, partial [Chloroflexota bacterium]|nr:BON domain-containing protein [Chloroflexota bacterium]
MMSAAAISRATPLLGARGYRPRVSDDELRARVYKAIAGFEPIRRVTLPHIRIEAADGVVTLSGHAASDTHKSMAAELAGDVPGVEAVQNKIVSDGELQRGIIRAFHEQPATRTVHAGFAADLGVVTLWGPAPSESFAKAAPEAVLSVPGVGCVLDMLSLDRDATARQPVVDARFGQTVVCQGRELGPIRQLFVERGSWSLKHALIRQGLLA